MPEPSAEQMERVRLSFRNTDELLRKAIVTNDSLLNGKLGMVLYYFTVYEAFGEQKDAVKGQELLEEIFAQINAGKSSLSNPSLSKGLAGLLVLLNYLSKNNWIDADMKKFRSLEEHLFKQCLYQVSHDFNDYLHGGFGALFYFLQRLPHALSEKYIRQIVELVFSKAVQTHDSFWLRNFLTSVEEKQELNLSLSHGQCGFFMILLQAFEQGILPERIFESVKKGVGHILRARQEINVEENKCSFFPIHIKVPNQEPVFRNRLAWCYGDLNVVLLLYRAGKLFEDERYIRLADLMGTATVNRTDHASTLCSDAHFCHGAAGLAQFYKTLFAAHALQPYADAYTFWMDKTVQFLDQDLEKGTYKEREAGLLDGLTGISLTLLDFLSKKELGWSRLLLL